MRQIFYLTGTRADFGLMRSTLELINVSPKLKLSLIVTGMHFDRNYGYTVEEIESSGLDVVATIPVSIAGETGGQMVRAISQEILAITDLCEKNRPDILLLLGDRGEMMAAALVGLHLNIPIVHIHGGERSGTVDESVRHSISKMSHYHFTATKEARNRLISMGENPNMIFVTGAPGLDDLKETPWPDREELCQVFKFDNSQPIALVVFHPVVQELAHAGQQAENIMLAVLNDLNYQALVVLPNADAGGKAIREVMQTFRSRRCAIFSHLPRADYLEWLRVANVLVGNSSSGLIEAATLEIPVVNVGHRQNCRERNPNVFDVDTDRESIVQGLKWARQFQGPYSNLYGDGNTGPRISKLLEELPLNCELLNKCNVY